MSVILVTAVKYLSRSNSVEGQMSRSFQGQIPQLVHNSSLCNDTMLQSFHQGQDHFKVKYQGQGHFKVKYIIFSITTTYA